MVEKMARRGAHCHLLGRGTSTSREAIGRVRSYHRAVQTAFAGAIFVEQTAYREPRCRLATTSRGRRPLPCVHSITLCRPLAAPSPLWTAGCRRDRDKPRHSIAACPQICPRPCLGSRRFPDHFIQRFRSGIITRESRCIHAASRPRLCSVSECTAAVPTQAHPHAPATCVELSSRGARLLASSVATRVRRLRVDGERSSRCRRACNVDRRSACRWRRDLDACGDLVRILSSPARGWLSVPR